MNAVKTAILAALLVFAKVGWADPLNSWTPANPVPRVSDLRAVAYGNGRFVAVGLDGVILSSAEGLNWVRAQYGPGIRLDDVAYGNGQFIVVGYDFLWPRGVILSSPDGVTWVERQAGYRYGGQRVTYGNGRFVTAKPWVLTSTNGADWAESTAVVDIQALAFCNGQFVATGPSDTNGPGTFWASTDGVSWTGHPMGVDYGIFGLAFGSSQYVAVGNDEVVIANNGYYLSRLLTSPDGVSWVQRHSGDRYALSGVAFAADRFVAVGWTNDDGAGVVVTSPDGINWNAQQPGLNGPLLGVAYGNGHFVAVGHHGTVLRSGTIITLELRPKPGTGLLSLWLSGESGRSYLIESSTNLIAWQSVTNITPVQSTSIVLELAPSRSGQVFYRASSD
ncbi:MAG: hypothetical protein NT154_39745 [Verrucomicrobia bacterium]|nr:hypothetical protein [Verrucomicrobiota bacterium]